MTRARLGWIGALVAMALLVVTATQLGRGDVNDAIAAADEGAWQTAVTTLDASDAWLPASATRWYDLGVLHHQVGDTPRALAAWRVARRLAPRDGDIAHNLAFARQELLEPPLDPVAPPLGWTEIVTPGELGVLAWLLWAWATWTTATRRREGRGHLPEIVVALTLATAASGVAWHGQRTLRTHVVAVTVVPTTARDGADLDAGERFTIPVGSELHAVARRGPWILVQTGDDQRGWVVADTLAMPDPGPLAAPRASVAPPAG